MDRRFQVYEHIESASFSYIGSVSEDQLLDEFADPPDSHPAHVHWAVQHCAEDEAFHHSPVTDETTVIVLEHKETFSQPVVWGFKIGPEKGYRVESLGGKRLSA